jgi:Outer membrane protein beta-barrel domain
MNNHGDSFEDFFKDAFKDAELEVRPQVWKGISGRLEQAPEPLPKVVPLASNRAVSSGPRFGRYAAVAVLLLGLGLAAYFLIPANKTAQIVQQPSNQTVPSDIDQKITDNSAQSSTELSEQAANPTQNQALTDGQLPANDSADAEPADGQNTEANENVARPLGNARVDVRTGGKTKAAPPNGLQLNKGYSNGNNTDGSLANGQVDAPTLPQLAGNAAPGFAPLFPTSQLVVGKVKSLTLVNPLGQLSGPLATVTVPVQAPKVDVGPQWWFTASGSYFNYTPGFANISTQMPSPFVNPVLRSIRSYDSTTLAPFLETLPQSRRSFGFNAEVGKALGRNWGISSGLAFTVQSYTYSAPVRFTIVGALAGNPPAIILANQLDAQATHLGLPLKAWYQTNGRGLNLRLSAGLLTDFTVGQRLNNTFEDVTYFLGDYRSLNFSAVGSAGLLYNLGPRWGLYADVQYRRAIGSVYDTPHLRATPTWLGGGLGVQYRW